MRGTQGVVVGLALLSVGFLGLGVALAQMMTHADPNAALLSVAGIGAYVVACLAMLAVIR